MARKPRLEVEGGLYHLITRGVDRRDIFHSPEDYQKFLSMLAAQKAKLPFYLYAYCLMTNHIHLLIERRTDDIGRIMHRVLTGYFANITTGVINGSGTFFRDGIGRSFARPINTWPSLSATFT